MLDMATRTAFNEDHHTFRETVRKVLEREVQPRIEDHERDGIVGRDEWLAAGEAGLLCPTVAEEYGGLGLDFRFNCVVTEELAYLGSWAGFPLQSDIAVDYIEHYGNDRIREAFLGKMISGEIIAAIAMTEPGTGSDLQGIQTTAKRVGDEWVINGSKTYITNGQNADIVIVVAKTNPDAGSKGISLIVVEADRPGFDRGRNLDKIGQHSADTSELFFNDVHVPADNILGAENQGFAYLMDQLPQERLSIAISAQASAQRAFDEAVNFTRERKAFGKPIIEFQNSQFQFADLKTKLQVGWAHLDWAINRHCDGKLTAAEASAAKLWHSETLSDIADMALQLHGGAGYMNEYPIAQLWRDQRVLRIYGGTSEVMKIVIGRSI
ncbi:MAG: acyl-CoA dehydrogenase family protein [Pseudomonadota bacterium]